jgi:Rieske Fe-S protein
LNDHGQPHQPAPSLWPIGFAVGIACILVGLVVSPVVAVVGAVIAVVFGFLWVRDLTRSVRAPAAEVEPETRAARDTRPSTTGDALPVMDEAEIATYPRGAFLSLSTLGLGALIGGVITVPVLGFMVLPSFTNQEEPEVDLGPIEGYPEGEFVIATFLEDPEIGEVSRRTMFIRNNGMTDQGPSFTMIYSRCAHLGCPVQPNALIEDDQKKTVESGVELTPLGTPPAGFGCPCHGGQYDTEGNRTAGPPVRALDRAEFSIVDGNLILGNFYSVSHVEGSGANARIYQYGRMPPGVHVDGPEAWLYPIEVPR